MSSQHRPVVLGLDAATPPASVALVEGAGIRAVDTGPFGRGTDAWIVGAVERVLADAGRDLAEVDVFAATAGPGTFTGIRVGLATAAGLARALGRPVAGIGTLEALVATARLELGGDAPVIAVVDARRGQLYAGHAPAGSPTLSWGPELVEPGELVARVAETPGARVAASAADLVEALPAFVPATNGSPLACGVGLAVGARLARDGVDGLPAARPVYVRPPDAVPGISPLRRRLRRR